MKDEFKSGPAKGRPIWQTVAIAAVAIVVLALIGRLIFTFPS